MTGTITTPSNKPAILWRQDTDRLYTSGLLYDNVGNGTTLFASKHSTAQFKFKAGYDLNTFTGGAATNMTNADFTIASGWVQAAQYRLTDTSNNFSHYIFNNSNRMCMMTASGNTAGITVNNILVSSSFDASLVPTLGIHAIGHISTGGKFLGRWGITDDRDTEYTPDTVPAQSITTTFHSTGMPDGTWMSGFYVKGWNTGYAAWQLMGGASTSLPSKKLYYRHGLGSTWEAWKTIASEDWVTSQITTATGSYLPLSGGTLTGALVAKGGVNIPDNIGLRFADASGNYVAGLHSLSGRLLLGNNWTNLDINSTNVTFAGTPIATRGVQIGSTADYGWYLYSTTPRICAGMNSARGVNVGNLLVSTQWDDYTKVPASGIYSKGNISTSGSVTSTFYSWTPFSSNWSVDNVPSYYNTVGSMYMEDAYNTASSPLPSYGTVVTLSGRVSHWVHQIYAGSDGKFYTRYATYKSDPSTRVFEAWKTIATEDWTTTKISSEVSTQITQKLGDYIPKSGGSVTSTGYIGLVGGTTFGIGTLSQNRKSGVFDTIECGSENDPLELCYYTGSKVIVGSGTNGTKPLYASNLYVGGQEVATKTFVSGSYLPLTGGTVTGNVRVSGLLQAYNWAAGVTNAAALTIDKSGGNAYGIGPTGTSMQIRYGAVTSISDPTWVSNPITHVFDGNIYMNINQLVATQSYVDTKVSSVTGNFYKEGDTPTFGENVYTRYSRTGGWAGGYTMLHTENTTKQKQVCYGWYGSGTTATYAFIGIDTGSDYSSVNNLKVYVDRVTFNNKNLAYASDIPSPGSGYFALCNGATANGYGNNFITAGNEFNFIPQAYASDLWMNYRTAFGTASSTGISSYLMGNGKAGYATVTASGFKVNGATSSNLLTAGGGNVAPASIVTKAAVVAALNVAGTNTITQYCDFTAGAGNSGSDTRFKKNVRKMKPMLDALLAIDIVTYEWEKDDEPSRKTFGVKAQQLLEKGGLFKRIVHERDDDARTMWVEYDRVGVLALKGLQEMYRRQRSENNKLHRENKELEKKNEELETRVKTMEERMEYMERKLQALCRKNQVIY